MFINLKGLQGEVTVSEDEFECRLCAGEAKICYLHDFMGALVWESCANCLISKVDDSKIEELKEKLKSYDGDKVPCLCPNLWTGCKCGAIARERFLKKNSLS